MNSPHHHHHHEHHDVHQQRLLWFFSFCNQRSSASSNSSSGSADGSNRKSSRRKSASSRNKFAMQYQQQIQRQQRQSSNVFGLDLIEHTKRFSDDKSVPHIVKSCAKFIEKHGIIFGIYRLSGMRVNIHKLRQDFDRNPKISMIDCETISNDAHAVACVLKQYFRELPTPLMTFHMYETFIELFKQSSYIDGNNDEVLTNNNNNTNVMTTDDQEPIYDIEHDSSTVDDDDDADADDQNDNNVVGQSDCNKSNTRKLYTSVSSDGIPPNASKQVTSSTPLATNKSKSAIGRIPLKSAMVEHRPKNQFTTSASDSQLISLSSVVTTTANDVKYQVRLDDLKRLLIQLPHAHYQTLRYLMRHLAYIAANGEKTGMDSKNVAIVWAPNLLKPRELELSAGLETLQVIGLQAVITEQLIKHHKFLFDDNDDELASHS